MPLQGNNPMAPAVRNADTLYDLSTSSVALLLCQPGQEPTDLWKPLTDPMRHSVLSKLALLKRLDVMNALLRDEEMFFRMLNLGHARNELHGLFQLMTETRPVSLQNTFTEAVEQKMQQGEFDLKYATGGLNMAMFLVDGGWFSCGVRVLEAIYAALPESIQDGETDLELLRRQIELRLLQALSSDCQLEKAKGLYDRLSAVEGEVDDSLAAPLLGQFTAHCLSRSLYHAAYTWALKAVVALKPSHHARIQIDVLRHASRACVLRRKFSNAEYLIEKAVLLAKVTYGTDHLKYSDALADYGFYLLNVDSVDKSVLAYTTAYDVRRHIFKRTSNLRVATLLEDLAYATYVRNYNSGIFFGAQELAENSLAIMERLLPKTHILRASPMRVLALILEEIAIDEPTRAPRLELLKRAEKLHVAALKLSIDSYGLMNVQTAKHYGNLGRLYQSMSKFPQAEQMHIRAICIKEQLLGTEDYELALSVGHLASLYNYDMKQFTRAETLYLRSISIGEKLFGSAYSGLEYDFRGLLKVYRELQDWDKTVEYMSKLRRWQDLRDTKRQNEQNEQQGGLTSRLQDNPLEKIVEVLQADEVIVAPEEGGAVGGTDQPMPSLMSLLVKDEVDDVLNMDLDFDRFAQ